MNRRTKAKLLLGSLALSAAFQLFAPTLTYADDDLITAQCSDPELQDPLSQAAMRGDLTAFMRAIKTFTNPTEELHRKRGSGENTILHLAIHHGNLNIIRYVLENYDVNLDLKNREGKTPLELVQFYMKDSIIRGLAKEQGAVGKPFATCIHKLADPTVPTKPASPLPPGYANIFVNTGLIEKMLTEIPQKRKKIKQLVDILPNLKPYSFGIFLGDLDRHNLLSLVTPDTINILIDGYPLIYHLYLNRNMMYTSDSYEVLCCIMEEKNMDLIKTITPPYVLENPGKFRTLLNAAISTGNLDAVNYLLTPDRSIEDFVPRRTRYIGKNPKILEALISHGIDLECVLLRAIRCDDFRTEYILAEQKGIRVSEENEYIKTSSLLTAAKESNYTLLRYLYYYVKGRRRQINTPDSDKQTPLQYALEHRNAQMAGFLCRHGANANGIYNHYHTPLTQALYNHSNIEMIKSLVENGADVNLPNEEHMTPLCCAARFSSSAEITKYLINKGAKINEPGGSGLTPLHFAVGSGSIDIVECLLDSGAKINQADDDGDTPLRYAAVSENIDMVKYLLKKGAEINQANNDGDTPLHCAARLGIHDPRFQSGAWKLLIESGKANVNLQNKSGNTPIALAILTCNEQTVRYLIEHGADLTIKNNEGKTPLQLAQECCPKIVGVLRAAGAVE